MIGRFSRWILKGLLVMICQIDDELPWRIYVVDFFVGVSEALL